MQTKEKSAMWDVEGKANTGTRHALEMPSRRGLEKIPPPWIGRFDTWLHSTSGQHARHAAAPQASGPQEPPTHVHAHSNTRVDNQVEKMLSTLSSSKLIDGTNHAATNRPGSPISYTLLGLIS
jgi:hypothetical protein